MNYTNDQSLRAATVAEKCFQLADRIEAGEVEPGVGSMFRDADGAGYHPVFIEPVPRGVKPCCSLGFLFSELGFATPGWLVGLAHALRHRLNDAICSAIDDVWITNDTIARPEVHVEDIAIALRHLGETVLAEASCRRTSCRTTPSGVKASRSSTSWVRGRRSSIPSHSSSRPTPSRPSGSSSSTIDIGAELRYK